MPITQLLEGAAFGPEETRIVCAAFDLACRNLGLVNRDDPCVKLVATAVINAARSEVGTIEELERRAQASINPDAHAAE